MIRVDRGWIVEQVDHCTCGGGFAAVGFAHEPGCGFEPLEPVRPLRAIVRTYPNSWAGYPHSWQWLIPNPVGAENDHFDYGWETTFQDALRVAHDQLRLLGELFAAYAEMAAHS